MIRGIGTDIIEISRVEEAVGKSSRFLDKVFTEREKVELAKKSFKAESIAGRFAVKEAVSKALGTGFRGFSFLDIEVISDKVGKPTVVLSDNIKNLFGLKDAKINVSISHNRKDAIAFVVIEEWV